MTKVVARTDDVAGFFSRAKSAAQKTDQGKAFDGTVTLSFEDPERMFTVLSQARRRLMLEVLHEPRTINGLCRRLHRNRSTVTRDVGLLEKIGLLVSQRQAIRQGTAFKSGCWLWRRGLRWWRRWDGFRESPTGSGCKLNNRQFVNFGRVNLKPIGPAQGASVDEETLKIRSVAQFF